MSFTRRFFKDAHSGDEAARPGPTFPWHLPEVKGVLDNDSKPPEALRKSLGDPH